MKTNFSHIIYAGSHTDAASWIVQLSSDSPDINITLDPDQVYMKTEDEQSSVQFCSLVCDSQGIFPSCTASHTGDSQSIPAFSLCVVATIFLFAIVFGLAVVFIVLYLYKKHIGPCCHDPQQAEPNNVILEQLVVLQPYGEPNNEEELVEMPPNDEPDNELQMPPNDEPNNEVQI